MPDPGRIHRSATSAMSIVMVVAGGALDATGILIGALFVFAGVVRLYVQTRGRPG